MLKQFLATDILKIKQGNKNITYKYLKKEGKYVIAGSDVFR